MVSQSPRICNSNFPRSPFKRSSITCLRGIPFIFSYSAFISARSIWKKSLRDTLRNNWHNFVSILFSMFPLNGPVKRIRPRWSASPSYFPRFLFYAFLTQFPLTSDLEITTRAMSLLSADIPPRASSKTSAKYRGGFLVQRTKGKFKTCKTINQSRCV